MTTADLDDMVTALVAGVLPGAEHRHEDRVHPYALSGRHVDVDRDGEWIEVAGCGLPHPRVLERVGLDAP